MIKFALFLLVSITLVTAENNQNCFVLTKDKDPVKSTSCDSVTILAGVTKRSTLTNEFLKDSSNLGYRIKIENIDGKYFWNTLTSRYISKIEKWECDLPYLKNCCISGLTLIVNFYPAKGIREALISKKDCENGYFIFHGEETYYKYYLTNEGIAHLRKFFADLILDFAKSLND